MNSPNPDSSVGSARSDPLLMSVLKSRFEAIVREMTLVVMRASRSAVIKNARDFSCAILTYDHRIVSTENALPIHVASMDLVTSPITELFDDIRPGDIFINNSPYHGSTHHADFTLAMPVFFEGEPLFWAMALSHHADTGAPVPTTYLPFAKTVYEEGIHYPCVRIMRDYKELDDVIRIGLLRNRVPELWLGDLRAQIGACKTAERRLGELLAKYGCDAIVGFVEDWFDYGRAMAVAEIKRLPAGVYRYETRHDPVPGVAEEGVPVRVEITVDSDEGMITVDVRDNIDNVPGGLNLTENTCTGSCRMSVFNNLSADMPHNHGSASRVKVLMREGSVIGKPRYPVGTSVATTNVNDRLISAGSCAFSEMGAPFGQAEGGQHLPIGIGVVSGFDPFKNGQPYVNQVFVAYSGGGARHGYDGWLTYCGPANGGMINLDSVEVDEAMYPFIIESRGVEKDTQGFGEFEGAPGVGGVFYPVDHDMTLVYAADGSTYAPRGVLGGRPAAPTLSRKWLPGGEIVDLPAFNAELCRNGEKLAFRACGGGGYGDPKARSPERVLRSINRGWLSSEKAEEVYGVSVRFDEKKAEYVLGAGA
ncbi:MAG TPA: hydantoinase B/oxoprolinase family protein [Mesorhizobium sp.]|jgi:N-methylhydantoinase B|nr:hydantoinase B/oxoprolinase family protein [Mesorhizobium sp.]